MAKGKTIMFTKIAKVTANKATIDPTDKSIPPVKITINIPILIIPIPDTCFNKLERFVEVKNTSEINAEKITSNIKMNIVLYFTKNLSTPPGLLSCFFIVKAII
ncbi:hypothetical protein GCM10022397_02960 [Flavivirga jejuensis]